jgi:hypothetical protein
LAPLETGAFKYELGKHDFIHHSVLFHKKLDVINLEFDNKIAALVAQLIFKQFIIEKQKQSLLANI